MNQDNIFRFNDGSLEIPALMAKQAHEAMAKKKDNKQKKQRGASINEKQVDLGGLSGDASDKEFIIEQPPTQLTPIKELKSERKKRTAAMVCNFSCISDKAQFQRCSKNFIVILYSARCQKLLSVKL